MSEPLIDHALVMDTDHIPGRGGYALVSASAGVTQSERHFVADNLGITDYLHAPPNARMYFSFFRVPDGRYAFVRRFVNGTRRNGVQNRLFVHTLFLDEDTFDALHGLPWLLSDIPVRPVGSASDTSLAKLIDPLQSDPEMPALEWEPPHPDAAHAALLRRMETLAELTASAEVLANLKPDECVARAAAALTRSSRLQLPQGPTFEHLTLLTWSMLPIPDRATRSWTQHDDGRVFGVNFDLANAPQVETAGSLAIGSTAVARRTVAVNIESARSWVEFANDSRQYTMLVWGAPDLHNFLQFRESERAPISDPLVPDEELLSRLRTRAESVRIEQREPWVNELAILRDIWTNITRSIDEQGNPAGYAIDRWIKLIGQSGIGRVIFREPPSMDWLDASEAQIGAELLIHFFLHGTATFTSAAATREIVARWALRRIAGGVRISSDPLARLAVSLAIDRSPMLVEMLTMLLGRADGFRALRSAISDHDSRLADAVLLAILTGLRMGHRDTGFFAREALLAQLEQKPSIGCELSIAAALSIGESLRDHPPSFVRYAFFLPDATLARLVLAVDSWLVDDARTWRPLGRLLLQQAETERRAGTPFARLAFTAAEQGEKSDVWLPALFHAAQLCDRIPRAKTVAAFGKKATTLSKRFVSDPTAAEKLLNAVREHVRVAPVGRCLRSLLMASRKAWPRMPSLAAETVEAIISHLSHRPAEWEACVLALLNGRSTAGPARAALAKFWHRMGAYDVEGVNTAAITAIYLLREKARDELVKVWTPRLNSLRIGPQADVLITVLRGIAAPALAPKLEIQIAWREIVRGTDKADTYTRLDLALQADEPKKRVKNFTEAIERRLRSMDPAECTAWLFDLYAAPCTLMTTQHVIETKILPDAMRKMNAAEWLIAIERGMNSLFVHDYFLFDVARRVGSSKAQEAARRLLAECVVKGRSTGIDAIIATSKGKLMPVTAGGTL